MKKPPVPLDLKRVKVQPLKDRHSESVLDEIAVEVDTRPPALPEPLHAAVREAAQKIAGAHKRKAGVMLLYGAHLIKNGGARIMNRLMELGWLTHLGTNGAGAIHDWEFSYLGQSTESVKKNVATGSFGTWDETGRCTHLALLAGALDNDGYGRSLGRFIVEDGVTLPETDALQKMLSSEPAHPLSPARAELLQAMLLHQLPGGRI